MSEHEFKAGDRVAVLHEWNSDGTFPPGSILPGKGRHREWRVKHDDGYVFEWDDGILTPLPAEPAGEDKPKTFYFDCAECGESGTGEHECQPAPAAGGEECCRGDGHHYTDCNLFDHECKGCLATIQMPARPSGVTESDRLGAIYGKSGDGPARSRLLALDAFFEPDDVDCYLCRTRQRECLTHRNARKAKR